MTPRRVLLVGNFDRKGLMRAFFNTEHKLWAGFSRLGHAVLAFSDRDVAREASLWRSSRMGANAMNARLLETAAHFRPHAVLFFHSDLVRAATFHRLRETVPGVRLGQINVDSVERLRTMAAFRARAAHLDRSFITTACPEALRSLSPHPGTVAFMPNPVDPAVETARVWDIPRDRLAHDVIFLGNADARRPAQAAALRDALPPDVRLHLGGGLFGTPRLSSVAFLDTLATGAQGPNFPLDETRPVPLLYSSNRLAILLGQGVLAHVCASAGFEALYGDGVLSYAGPEALAEACGRLARDDTERRRIAERGWRIAHERTRCDRVAAYLLDSLMGDLVPGRYGWPDMAW